MNSSAQTKAVHNHILSMSASYLGVLESLRLPEAELYAPKLRSKVDRTCTTIERTLSHKLKVAELKVKSKTAEKRVAEAVGGIYAIVEADDPPLFALLPDRAVWAEMPQSQQATHLQEALLDAGGSGLIYAAKIGRLVEAREAAMNAWVEAGSMAEAVLAADNELAELKLLLAQIDIALRPHAQLGTPLLELLKDARSGGKKKVKAKATPKVPETKPAVPASAAPQAVPETKPAEPVAPATTSADLAFAGMGDGAMRDAANGANGVHR